MLLDLSMPGGGLAALAELRTLDGLRVAVLTASEERDDVMRALAAGAAGYLVKGIGSRALIEAIRQIAAGEGYVAPGLAARILTESRASAAATGGAAPGGAGNDRPQAAEPATDAARPGQMLEQLTPRETEVLRLVAQGCSNKEIARIGAMQEKTVKHHMTRILHKLNARNRTEAAMLLRAAAGPGLTPGVSAD